MDIRLPKYSVLMSLYQGEKPEYLRQALDSMMAQTYLPSEIVIVKDGLLPDELNAVLNEYQSKYANVMRIVGYSDNRGLGKALNYGIDICKNEYIARMDTDDISKPERCEKELLFLLSNPPICGVGSWVDEFEGDPTNVISTRRVPIEQKDIYKFCKRRNPFNHPSMMYKKSAVTSVGGYSSLRYGQDYDLFGRLLINGYLLSNIPESLLYFRTGSNAIRRRKNKQSIKCYIDTVKYFNKMHYSSVFDVLYVEISQMLLYILPETIVKRIYKVVRK